MFNDVPFKGRSQHRRHTCNSDHFGCVIHSFIHLSLSCCDSTVSIARMTSGTLQGRTVPLNETKPQRGAVGDAPTFLSDQENKDLLMMAGYAIGAAFLMKFLFQAMFAVYVLAFPLVYVYAVQTCPSLESFDVKKELKRVLRGHHLPEDHPNKPKGFLSEVYAKVAASVTTELATGLGYEVTLYPLLGAAAIAAVRVPSVRTDCYWIGVFGKWRYLFQKEILSRKSD